MILYLHGFRSSPTSFKARMMADAMAARGLSAAWACPQLPASPREAIDLAMGIGIFRWFWAIEFGQPAGIYDSFSAQAVMIGVWGRAALLVALFVAFLKARDVTEDDHDDTSFIRGAVAAKS